MLVVALIGLALVRLHALLERRLQREGSARVFQRASLALIAAGSMSVTLGVLAVFRPLRISSFLLLKQAALGFGIGMLAYGASLHGRAAIAERPPQPTEEERRARLASLAFVTAIILLSLFWATAEYAEVQGRARATR